MKDKATGNGVDRYSVKALERGLMILDFCASAEDPITAQSVATHLGINTNMAFRMLSTINAAGYLTKDEASKTFSLSLKTLQLSRKAMNSFVLRRMVMPYLDSLHQKYPRANYNLGVLYQGEVVVVDHIDSITMPRTYFTAGKILPFHATALGKILTCELPEAELDALIQRRGLKPYTKRTITDTTSLKHELDRVKAEHVARDREESIPNDNCNAVPIRDGSGSIVAAISMTAFDSYITVEEIETLIPVLMETGRVISYQMGYNV